MFLQPCIVLPEDEVFPPHLLLLLQALILIGIHLLFPLHLWDWGCFDLLPPLCPCGVTLDTWGCLTCSGIAPLFPGRGKTSGETGSASLSALLLKVSVGLSEMRLGFKCREPPGCVRALREALAVPLPLCLAWEGHDWSLSSAKCRWQRQKALFGGALSLDWSLSGVCAGEVENSGQERTGRKRADFQGLIGAEK